MAFDEISEDNVYTCVGHPLRKDIENIVYWILNENFTTAYNSILYHNAKSQEVFLKACTLCFREGGFCII